MKTLALLVAFTILTVGCVGQDTAEGNTGQVVFGVTDAPANLNSVSSVEASISGLRMHSIEGNAWVEIGINQTTFDLMELRSDSEIALLAQAQIPAGTYNQIRFVVDSVTITDANGTREAKLPSNEIKFDSVVIVEENATSSIELDFDLDKSLHVTGKGEFVMAPVINVESRSRTDVDAAADGRIRITGGEIKSSKTIGMDANGNVGVGLSIPANTQLSVGITGSIQIGTGSTMQNQTQNESEGNNSPQSFSLEADDDGFYPSGTIEVDGGAEVTINFKIRNSNVYYGGLRFESPYWEDVKGKPGETVSVNFTAEESFDFKSYWPNTNNLKAVGHVVVS